MTFGEAKQVIEELVSQNPEVTTDDVAKVLVDKQKEWEMTDLDLGILLSSIGAEKFITQDAAQAMQQDGLMGSENGNAEEPAPEENDRPEGEENMEEKEETETKTETETETPEPEEKERSEEDEKEEVRQLYTGR